MLGKLFKYEWKSGSRLFLLIHGGVLLFALLSRLFLTINGGLNQAMATSENHIISMIASMIIFGIVVFISCTAIFTYVYIAYRFYKNIFTDQGYLTNTLPVTPSQIIVSKMLNALLWIIIDLVVLAFSLCIIFVDNLQFFSDFFHAMGEVFSLIGQLPPTGWLIILCIILSPFLMILHLYFSVALGNLIASHKVIGSIIAYFGSYTILQIISTMVVAFTYNNSSAITKLSADVSSFTPAENMAYVINLLNPALLCTLGLCVTFLLLFWFTTRYIMNRKLNLQ